MIAIGIGLIFILYVLGDIARTLTQIMDYKTNMQIKENYENKTNQEKQKKPQETKTSC